MKWLLLLYVVTKADLDGPGGPFLGTTLADFGGRLRVGAVDLVELIDETLAAITAAQPAYNAFVSLDADGARTAAGRLREELARGIDRGPLHGVPVGVKDLIDTAGLTTTMGSRHFAGNVPTGDAEVVTRLRAAGAIVVGKTTTHEFAYGPTGDIAANGPCANPRDRQRMAGGSSAGSAAAVAAGLVPLALGTDTGGSVRIPAALCGVVGFRPSYDRLPTTGVFPLSWSLDTVGPIAGNVADIVLAWNALTGKAMSRSAPSTSHIGRPVAGWFDRVDPAVRAGVEELIGRLVARGATVRDVPVPDAEELVHVYRTVQSAEVVSVHHGRLADRPDLFEPETLDRLRTAARVPAWEYAVALRRLQQLRGAAAERLAGLDALVLPTVPVLAPPLGARDTDVGGGWTSPRDALLAFASPWSVLGLPSISVPGFAPGRLPVGVQLVGPPGGDEGLLALWQSA